VARAPDRGRCHGPLQAANNEYRFIIAEKRGAMNVEPADIVRRNDDYSRDSNS
jgi:hypothetical protein